MKRFVLGDIHGEYDYLMDVLKKSGFDYENDLLIQIGDIVDRGPEPFKCIDELMKIKNLICLAGNHDVTFLEWVHTGAHPLEVRNDHNGIVPTIKKWQEANIEDNKRWLEFLENQDLYHVTEDNICFVHGGFDRWEDIENQHPSVYVWDRELVQESMSCKGDQKLKTVNDFKKIFIGHTPTLYWGKLKPIISGGVYNVDTGSGKGGALTIMNIDTEEYWQSNYNEAKLVAHGIIEKKEDQGSQGKDEESNEECREAA